jgi:glycosyltransferase involved in cell wall biosynthesis
MAATEVPLDLTVVIAVYQRARLITRALDSVRAQTRLPREIIVVDDASSDDTVAVVNRWATHHRFALRLEVLETNSGPAAARNRGIALAQTNYVSFLDSDDEYAPEALTLLVPPLDAVAELVVSFADATVLSPTERKPHGLMSPRVDIGSAATPLFDAGAGVFRLNDAKSSLLGGSFIPTCAASFRRDAALAVGGMPESFRSGEDWLFWLRLAGKGGFAFQVTDLAVVHRHDENITHPEQGAFIASQKLHALTALLDGSLNIDLNREQRSRLGSMLTEQLQHWRYHLSRLGLQRYLAGLRQDASAAVIGSPLHQCLRYPKSLLRAVYYSLR